MVVAQHKTSAKYGPATLVMSKLYAQMESYIKYFWPSAVSTETHPKNLFINWGGSSMDPRSVMHALTTVLGHTGIEKRLTCNPIHHLAFTLLSGLLSERDLQGCQPLKYYFRILLKKFPYFEKLFRIP